METCPGDISSHFDFACLHSGSSPRDHFLERPRSERRSDLLLVPAAHTEHKHHVISPMGALSAAICVPLSSSYPLPRLPRSHTGPSLPKPGSMMTKTFFSRRVRIQSSRLGRTAREAQRTYLPGTRYFTVRDQQVDEGINIFRCARSKHRDQTVRESFYCRSRVVLLLLLRLDADSHSSSYYSSSCYAVRLQGWV